MFIVKRISEKRLEIVMSGSLDAQAMASGLDELLEKSEGFEKAQMLFDIVEYKLPSLPAIALEFSRLPQMLGFIGKFSRAAVLTDATWLKVASEFEGKLIPSLQIKAFDRDQRQAAEAWLNEAY